ncbi:DeoR/GlpR family DNA-binding transcription regulator [Roseicyclus sp. F158]|uniref:DeoR/GlpR family DNA-binding transcription regulator n=1 Tax=Tropicimonas omnivorans TaxID=3075590 RepID=A0ABU3DEL5_9RHOB|nr:DeoR/GlpR family DNA-binding transcription regulator [Roseicyclus sp. F158]MDT0682158.1 DeoR/GlpR family DNA-binding transcription regulator [Roseicyclus sp. F158]
MTRPSGLTHRIELITALLDVTPSLRLRDVAEQLGVTEMTLRRDAASSGAGFACRGGYIVPDRYDFDAQMQRAIEAKRQAAERALGLVPQDASVFLDTGTTLPHLARLLAQGRAARIVTHCLTLADLLQGRIEVELLGGSVKAPTRSCHPGDPEAALRPYQIDMAFLSAGGMDGQGLLSCSHDYEIALKRAALAKAPKTFVVMDDSKRGRTRPAGFARVSDLDGFVTESGVFTGIG